MEKKTPGLEDQVNKRHKGLSKKVGWTYKFELIFKIEKKRDKTRELNK